MIKIEITEDARCSCSLEGDTATLFADTIVAVRAIYDGIQHNDVCLAEVYKANILDSIALAFTPLVHSVTDANVDADLMAELRRLKEDENR